MGMAIRLGNGPDVAYTETMTPDPRTSTDRSEGDDSSAVAALLEASRAELDRVEPEDLHDEMAAGALVVDIRPIADREADGALPGAVAIERIHLEWRLDPTSPHRIPGATPGRRIIVMCNEGYASSLAAVTLRSLGVARATDLAGGFRAWARSAPMRRREADGAATDDESVDRVPAGGRGSRSEHEH